MGDLNGKGESEPIPHFYQNLAEAEYVVAVFMYMRLIGYPASKIAILTLYNGQKDLIRDVIGQRCAWNPLFGRPSIITTVDKYQGQQSDYVLLSLVRTKSVGHLRDVRRLIVAMSRARLGLYVFGRRALFESCYELSATMEKFAARPTALQLQMGEVFPGTRMAGEKTSPTEMADLAEMGAFVFQMMEEQMKRVGDMQKQQQLALEAAADAMRDD